MAAYMDFDAATDEENGEGASFDLNGRTWHLLPEIPLGTLMEVGKITDMEANADALPVLVDLIAGAVIPDESDDFRKSLETVGPTKFWRVTAWIVETIAGRPFAELLSSVQSASSATAPSNNDSSTGDTPPVPPSDSPPVPAAT